MAGEKAWENLWNDKTEAVFNDIFEKAKPMDDNWDATGMATPIASPAYDEPAEVKRPSTIDRLIEAQKAFNDHLLEDNKRLKSEIAELQAAVRQTP